MKFRPIKSDADLIAKSVGDAVKNPRDRFIIKNQSRLDNLTASLENESINNGSIFRKLAK